MHEKIGCLENNTEGLLEVRFKLRPEIRGEAFQTVGIPHVKAQRRETELCLRSLERR